MSKSAGPQAFFLTAGAGSAGHRFCIYHAPQTARPAGRIIYLHPFAEEMNKARRMAALQSRALAAAGFAVLQIDLHGCGDSSGDFGDASWQGWIDDVLSACDWLRQRDPQLTETPMWLWGLRAGCLLAAAAAPQLDEPANFCFWQPTVAGSTAVQQFLRLRLAADLLGGSNKGVMDLLRAELAGGNSVEVAGYALAPAVARGLELAKLTPPQNSQGRLEWFEITTRNGAAPMPLTPVAADALARWRDAGFTTRHHVVTGPQFWQTTEIETAMALIGQTCAALQPHGAAS